MDRYDKDMMHERELIYDAKGQLHKADERYKKGDKGAKKEMIHDRELIYDAKTDIHKEDVAKHEEHGHHASVNKVHRNSRKNQQNNHGPYESAELRDMPIVTDEKEGGYVRKG